VRIFLIIVLFLLVIIPARIPAQNSLEFQTHYDFKRFSFNLEDTLKYTAIFNTAMDLYQTNFLINNSRFTEADPVWKGFIARGDRFGLNVCFAGFYTLAYFGIQSIKDSRIRTLCYAWWAIVEATAVMTNVRNLHRGFFIVIPVCRF